MRRIAAISFVGLIGIGCTAQGPVVEKLDPQYDFRDTAIARKAVAIQEAELSHASALSMSKSFLAETAQATFAELIIGTTSELRLSTRGVNPRFHPPPGFDETLEAIGSLPNKAVARVLRIGGNAIFSFRSPGVASVSTSNLTEQIIEGKADPTNLEVADRKYRLLTLAEDPNSNERLTSFFLAYGEQSCEDCQELAKRIAGSLPATSVKVRIRPDTWFEDPRFPLVFRFEPDRGPGAKWRSDTGAVIPPTVEQYYRGSDESQCELLNGRQFFCQRWSRTRVEKTN